jgi:anti-anti-sigma factor
MSGIGRRVVLSAAGEIDIATADVLAGALEDAIDSGAADVWVDLTQVDFMDSSGAHALLDARTRTVALNRHLCVICPPGEPRRVLELTRLTGLLGVATSRAAAHQAS